MSQTIVSTQAEFDIYDFDHTIYKGDCSLDFYWFCLRKNPTLIVYLPYQFWHAGLFALRLENRTDFKSHFFIYLRGIKDSKKILDQFWNGHFSNIKKWYLESNHSKDVIISASPEFLLQPAFDKLRAHTLIATRMNPVTGKINGLNCRGQEKVVRLEQALGEPKIKKVYSDSMADMPLLKLGKEKYIVKGDKITQLD